MSRGQREWNGVNDEMGHEAIFNEYHTQKTLTEPDAALG